jgi:hypothetical protein
MTKTIYKYTLPFDSGMATVRMPRGAKILAAREHGSYIGIWAEVIVDNPSEERSFIVAMTGGDCPDGRYIGTASFFDGRYIAHVYDVTATRGKEV